MDYVSSGGGDWSQKGVDIDGEAADDRSGHSVSSSSAGRIGAIGAWQNDGAGSAAGHVRVYAWSGSAWVQRGADIDGGAAGDRSGHSVSLSSDGSIVAIGANYNGGTGINAGHVRVYAWSGSAWVQRGADIDGEAAGDFSGHSVSLSSDGSIVAIGAYGNDGAGSGAGHVRVYEYSGSSWSQKGADIDGEAAGDTSGYSVSLSDDGNTVTIGAPYNDGTGTNVGHVRVYETISPLSPQVGDWAVAEHKEETTEQLLATYTYRVTQVTNADTLVLEFVSATDGYTDDSPCDLCDGTGSLGVCQGIAPHVIKRDLGGMFMVLMY